MTTHLREALRAYHNDPLRKISVLAQVEAHRKADQLIKGQYWENGKGCAVGCTIHSGDHVRYESELGIPVMLAYLEDRIFEGLPNGHALDWPEHFLGAIRVGADLSRVGPQFLVAVLERRLHALAPETFGVRAAIEQTLTVLRDWADTGTINAEAAAEAAEAARAAARAAEAARAAARAAERAAWAAWAAEAAAGAAWAAAEAAEAAEAARAAARAAERAAAGAAAWAAWAAEAAARAAERAAARAAEAAAGAAEAAAGAAGAAGAAARAAEAAEYVWMADALLALLRAA